MPAHLVLASASPARLALLRGSGLDPEVIVSGVDEDALDQPDVALKVAELARQKANQVAGCRNDGFVLGCDSLLEFEGTARGKPVDLAQACAWWREMRGHEARLFTGHCLIDVTARRAAEETVVTAICFGQPSDEEIDHYLASGEALAMAGGFSLAGRSAAFLDGIRGDANSVEGLSLAALRRLLLQLGSSLASFSSH